MKLYPGANEALAGLGEIVQQRVAVLVEQLGADRNLEDDVRPAGAPIRGMQGRPASGPLSLLRAFITLALNYRLQVADVPAME